MQQTFCVALDSFGPFAHVKNQDATGPQPSGKLAENGTAFAIFHKIVQHAAAEDCVKETRK